MQLDCRDKLVLEDGSTCILLKNKAFAHLPRFDLYDSSGALLVKCRMIGKFFSYLSFTDARGQELATIRFKWALPILHLPDGSKTELSFQKTKMSFTRIFRERKFQHPKTLITAGVL